MEVMGQRDHHPVNSGEHIAVVLADRGYTERVCESPRPVEVLVDKDEPLPHRGVFGQRRDVQRSGDRDRKSTRLNSSHGYISYAVFCLKKKIHGAWEFCVVVLVG